MGHAALENIRSALQLGPWMSLDFPAMPINSTNLQGVIQSTIALLLPSVQALRALESIKSAVVSFTLVGDSPIEDR